MLKSLALLSALLCALPVSAAILGPDAAACRSGSSANAVLLTVDGFKSRDGNLRVELWPGTQEDFLRDHHALIAEGKAYQRVTVPIPTSGPAKVCVKLPGAGTYALGAFHSPSGERKFNYRTDGATFTRNPRMGIFNSRPRAADVAMQFNAGLNESVVTLNYLRGLAFRPIPREELQSAERQP